MALLSLSARFLWAGQSNDEDGEEEGKLMNSIFTTFNGDLKMEKWEEKREKTKAREKEREAPNKALLVWRFPFHRHHHWVRVGAICSLFFYFESRKQRKWTSSWDRISLLLLQSKSAPCGVHWRYMAQFPWKSQRERAAHTKEEKRLESSESWRLKWTLLAPSFIFNGMKLHCNELFFMLHSIIDDEILRKFFHYLSDDDRLKGMKKNSEWREMKWKQKDE